MRFSVLGGTRSDRRRGPARGYLDSRRIHAERRSCHDPPSPVDVARASDAIAK